MKILYICGAGGFGGSSRSLFEAVSALPDLAVEAYFLTKKGDGSELYRSTAKDVIAVRGLTRFDNSRASYYRRQRWVVVLRELFFLPFTIYGLLKAKSKWRHFDLVHINDVTDILSGLAAKALFGARLVVHTRCLQRTDRNSFRVRWLHRILDRHASAIVAIDGNVAATLPPGDNVTVIHNSFEPASMSLPGDDHEAEVRWTNPQSLKVGFLGNFYLSKGILELADAARLADLAGCEIEYLAIGGATAVEPGLKWRILSSLGLAQEQGSILRQRLDAYGLAGKFHMVPRTSQIENYLRQIDVLVFPSHLNACGRPVFEAAFFAKPSIVAVDNPLPDTLNHRVTGIAIASPEPHLIAGAMTELCNDRPLVRTLGENARQLAVRNFSRSANSKKLLSVYAMIMADKSAENANMALEH